MADVQHRVNELENEIKVLKNEIKAMLLDIREQYLNAENPFVLAAQAGAGAGGGPMIHIGGLAGGAVAAEQPQHAAPPEHSAVSVLALDTHTATEATRAENESFPGAEEDTRKDTLKASDDQSLPSLETPAEHASATKSGGLLKAKKGAKREADDVTPPPGLEPDADDDDSGERGGGGGGMSLPGLGPAVEERESLMGTRGRGRKDALRKRGQNGGDNGNSINLLTIAGLSKWVDESTDKIGKERAEVMVKACYMVGHISEELKDLLVKLVRLAQVDEPRKTKVTTRDYLGVIAQLDSLLGYGSESEAALLTILADTKDSSSG